MSRCARNTSLTRKSGSCGLLRASRHNLCHEKHLTHNFLEYYCTTCSKCKEHPTCANHGCMLHPQQYLFHCNTLNEINVAPSTNADWGLWLRDGVPPIPHCVTKSDCQPTASRPSRAHCLLLPCRQLKTTGNGACTGVTSRTLLPRRCANHSSATATRRPVHQWLLMVVSMPVGCACYPTVDEHGTAQYSLVVTAAWEQPRYKYNCCRERARCQQSS